MANNQRVGNEPELKYWDIVKPGPASAWHGKSLLQVSEAWWNDENNQSREGAILVERVERRERENWEDFQQRARMRLEELAK